MFPSLEENLSSVTVSRIHYNFSEECTYEKRLKKINGNIITLLFTRTPFSQHCLAFSYLKL